MSVRVIGRPVTSSTRIWGAVAARLLAVVFLPGVLMPVVGCRAPTASDGASPPSVPTKTADRPPIAPAVLRADAERQAEWTPFRKAACPRQLADRHEELRLYPAISILEGLGYITITDGTAYGMYVKNMEITDAGRRALGSDLEEGAETYVITIASREYLPGTEQFEIRPETNKLVANFKWRWKPLNTLGERLTLGPEFDRSDYGGFATYTRDGEVWTLDKVFLNIDNRDYMRRVSR